MSNVGTRSATATTSCELTTIMETEIGIPHSCSYFARLAKRWPENHFLLNQQLPSMRKPTCAGDSPAAATFLPRMVPLQRYPLPGEAPIALLIAANKEFSCKGFKRKATRAASS